VLLLLEPMLIVDAPWTLVPAMVVNMVCPPVDPNFFSPWPVGEAILYIRLPLPVVINIVATRVCSFSFLAAAVSPIC